MGGADGVLGGVYSGDIGDATLAAMTNLESDNTAVNTIVGEEDEEEVYGIFTGNEIPEIYVNPIYVKNNVGCSIIFYYILL